MRYVVLFVMAMLSVILQCSVFTTMPLFGVQLDLVLLLMAGLIMAEKTMTPLYYFVLCALYMDVLFAEAIGYYTLPYAVAGLFVYLVARRVIKPVIPLCFIGTVFVFTWILGEDPVFQILSGGLMLGAIFMATDYTTSPLSTKGRIVFGIGCGIITVLIRVFGALPEGVSFSIILMNILVPHIERITRPRPFGVKKEKAKKEAAHE